MAEELEHPSLEALHAAKRRARRLLASVPGVVGFALDDRSGSIEVHLSQPAGRRKVPRQVEGIPVRVIVVGQVSAAHG